MRQGTRLTRLNDLILQGKDLKGRWQLGRGHELQYRAEGKNEDIRLRGSLIAAQTDALVFSVTEKQKDQKIVTHLWKLAGRWRTDPKNQILFEVERESGKNDLLVFTGGWRLGEHQELLYNYKTGSLEFRGMWDISEKNRLAYLIGGDAGSALRFRGAFQTKSILAKKGEIRYQLGAEVSGKSRLKNILLFGKWKYSDKLGLSFEMEYGARRKKTIRFGGSYALTDDKTVTVELSDTKGSALGAEVILTRDLFGGNGEAFARFRRSVQESRVEGGLQFAW